MSTKRHPARHKTYLTKEGLRGHQGGVRELLAESATRAVGPIVGGQAGAAGAEAYEL